MGAGNADTCTFASNVSVVCVFVSLASFAVVESILVVCTCLCGTYVVSIKVVAMLFAHIIIILVIIFSLSRFVRRLFSLPSVHASHHASLESSFLILFYFSWSHNYGCYI